MAELGWPPGRVVEPARAQVLHLRRHHLAARLHPALGHSHRRRLRPVLHHCVRRPGVVRLHLPAKRVDLDFHVVRKGHRGRPQPAHEARQSPHERQQVPAQVRQAQPVAADRLCHRHDLCRLFLAHPRAGHRILHRSGRWLGLLLGRLLHPRHLRQRRLAARAGVRVHVPLRTLPERDVRQGHADRFLRPAPWRNPRPAQKRPGLQGRGPGRLHRLHHVRAGLPHRHRHP
ncbi:hypothetical protein D3C80_240170 [compost metagenome]